MFLVVPSLLDAAIVPYDRQHLIIKLDMKKKHPKHNLHKDDLLKPVETEELAIRLIRDIKAMRDAGGFNLTKSFQIRWLLNQFQNMIEEMM